MSGRGTCTYEVDVRLQIKVVVMISVVFEEHSKSLIFTWEGIETCDIGEESDYLEAERS